MIHNFWKKLKHALHDSSGSITVEFVIWFPLLMFWLLGTIVFFDGFKARSNLSTANSTIADIVSRTSEITETNVTEYQNLQTGMLPRTTGNGLRISSIQFAIDPTIPGDPGSYTVEWSAVAGAATEVLVDEEIDIASLPNMYDGEILIFVESSVPFQPITTYLGISFQTLRNEIAISPRYDSRIAWVEE